MATIGRYYLSACTSAASKQGVDINALMAIAGIRQSTSTSRISDSAMSYLLTLLVKATNDAFFGFSTNKTSPQYFELLCQSLYYCKNIEQAIKTLTIGFALVGCKLDMNKCQNECETDFETDFETKEALLITLSHQHQDPDHFLLEYLLVFTHRVLSWLSGKRLPLICAQISYSPCQYQQEFSLLFRCPVIFNQKHNGLVFTHELLTLPNVRQKHEFEQLIEQFPLIILRFPGEECLISTKVYQLLCDNFAQHQVLFTATQVAVTLNISTATLRRQLADQLTSFTHIKSEFRKEQALKLLQQKNNNIDVIATLLGYSEARAFSRIFKQWTGLTPSQYRQLM